MVDRTQPLKLEDSATGGTETDEFPTALDRNEDYVDCRGVAVQNDTSDDSTALVSRDASNNLTFVDGVTSIKTLAELASGGGMTEAQHLALDVLVHDLDENYYEEYTYTTGKVTNITVWTDSGKTKKIREYQYTYTTGKVSQEVIIQYDGSGTEVERLTLTYTYSGNLISSIDTTRT